MKLQAIELLALATARTLHHRIKYIPVPDESDTLEVLILGNHVGYIADTKSGWSFETITQPAHRSVNLFDTKIKAVRALLIKTLETEQENA